MRKRVLIVDDDESNVLILQKLLSSEYELTSVDSGEACLEMLKEFGPDLVLLDVMMPGIDGFETCRRIKSAPCGEMTQVMLVSALDCTDERVKGYEAGADDYLVKPFDHGELLAKVRIQFRLRGALTNLAAAHAEIEMYNARLERLVQERTREVVETRDLTVFAMAKLAESRDPETGEHLERMRAYSQILGKQLAREGPYRDQIDQQFLDDLYRSSPLHDIGKVGIPDGILLKPGQLSGSEFDAMKRHTLIGTEALHSVAGHSESGGFLNMAVDIARSHHERFNGSGYPAGLSGQDIPLPARIVALADVYDALTSVRVYKDAFLPEVARTMIEQEEGKHFDPALVTAFRARWDDFLKVRVTVGDGQPEQVATMATPA